MNLLAFALFAILFAFGRQYIGWQDPSGRVELTLIATFILGMIGRGKS